MSENTRVLLRRQCDGVPVADDFEVTTGKIETPSDGQLLCETIYLSLDPYLRGRISGRHLSGAILPGELMAGEAISRVTESRHPDFSAGGDAIQFGFWRGVCVSNTGASQSEAGVDNWMITVNSE